MARALLIFRIILVTATAGFMAFHTQKFIYRVEPNAAFAWLASFLIECMLISLALMRTFTSRILLIPVFLISVISASMSFIVKNEVVMESFIQNTPSYKHYLARQLEHCIRSQAYGDCDTVCGHRSGDTGTESRAKRVLFDNS
jgi:hypothetical protein